MKKKTDTEKGGRIADVKTCRVASPTQVPSGDGVAGDCDAGPTGPVQKPDSPRPDAPDVVDLSRIFAVPPASGAARSVPPDGLFFPERVRFKDKTPRFLRFLEFRAQKSRVHWVPEGSTSVPIQCLGDQCPLCQARLPCEFLLGLPVLDVSSLAVEVLSWGSKTGEMSATPAAKTIPDLVRAVLYAQAPCVATVTKEDKKYEFSLTLIGDVSASMDLGDAEINAFQQAMAEGRVQLELGISLTRQEILERFPSVGRTALLADAMKVGDERTKQIQDLLLQGSKKGSS